jgi:5-amino-6-(5-phosphoribosylamino)uracil reductase
MNEPGNAAPPGRPFVTLNVAESIDGKIAPIDGGKINFGSAEDRAQMETLRAGADGVMIGAGTLRAEDPPLLIRDPAVQRIRVASKGTPHPRNIAICSRLPDGLAAMSFFQSPETEKLVFTTGRTAPELCEAARRFARIEVVPLDNSGRVDLTEVLRRLPPLGVSHLLLEGGGELNFSMLQAGLVDEIYLTLCPFVFGGRTAPTSFDGAGFPRQFVKKLALKSHRLSASGEVFLHYDVLQGTPPRVAASRLFPEGFEVS